MSMPPDFRALFAVAPTPMLIVAPDAPRFSIIGVNEAYLAATMRTRDDLVGSALFEAMPDNPDDADATGVNNLRASIERAIASKRADRMALQKYDIPHPTGGFEERWWDPVNMPVVGVGDEVNAVIHQVTDVTHQVRAEAALRRSEVALRSLNEELEQRVADRTGELMHAEEALRQSQKMEAVGQLTGGLAHDFNNLLTGISGSLELMQARLLQGRVGDLDRYMAAAQGASRRAAALTHRLLAFSRRQTLDPRPTDINCLVGGMQELVQRTVGPGIVVEVIEASDLWSALVDPSQLESALLNLCLNARDAMPDGGRITIKTGNKWFDLQAATQHDVPEGQYLSLCVTDTGTGMSPEVVTRVFEPFFTTKPIGKGTGLGLSMVYGFGRQSGGQVCIHSEVGEGTTVCIYLPCHYGEADKEAPAAVGTALAPSTQGKTVLVVDDEPTVRMLVTDILTELGYAVLEEADSAMGLKVLRSDARIDLLVTDVGLPGGMNGRQMADAARMVRPDLKVLFITGYAENSVLNDDRLEPGMAVLTKPFAVEAIGARIKGMIEGQ